MVLAVVGFGHMQGVMEWFQADIDQAKIDEIAKAPPRLSWKRFLLHYFVVPLGLLGVGVMTCRRVLLPALRSHRI